MNVGEKTGTNKQYNYILSAILEFLFSIWDWNLKKYYFSFADQNP